MRTIVWWSVWGLAVAIGVIGLLEARNNSYHLLLAIPLLTGAVAAAGVRMEYEYHHLLQHLKWMGISSLFLMGIGVYVYTQSHALGPFATGTEHRAILGTTFGMSVPEVERVLGRALESDQHRATIQDRAHAWMLETLPVPGDAPRSEHRLSLILFDTPADAVFHFQKGRLGRVELKFPARPLEPTLGLIGQLKAAMAKEYTEGEIRREDGLTVRIFRKESVETRMVTTPRLRDRYELRVESRYLPYDAPPDPPLAVTSNLF